MAENEFNIQKVQESGFDKIRRGLGIQNSAPGSIAPPNMPDSLMGQWLDWSAKYQAAVKASDLKAISETAYQLYALQQKAGPATAG